MIIKLTPDEQRFWDMIVASSIGIQWHPANHAQTTNVDKMLSDFADTAEAAIHIRRRRCLSSPGS